MEIIVALLVVTVAILATMLWLGRRGAQRGLVSLFFQVLCTLNQELETISRGQISESQARVTGQVLVMTINKITRDPEMRERLLEFTQALRESVMRGESEYAFRQTVGIALKHAENHRRAQYLAAMIRRHPDELQHYAEALAGGDIQAAREILGITTDDETVQ